MADLGRHGDRRDDPCGGKGLQRPVRHAFEVGTVDESAFGAGLVQGRDRADAGVGAGATTAGARRMEMILTGFTRISPFIAPTPLLGSVGKPRICRTIGIPSVTRPKAAKPGSVGVASR